MFVLDEKEKRPGVSEYHGFRNSSEGAAGIVMPPLVGGAPVPELAAGRVSTSREVRRPKNRTTCWVVSSPKPFWHGTIPAA